MTKDFDTFDLGQFEGRKREHIRLALDPAHQASGRTGLEAIHLFHDALPELDMRDVRLESSCVGRTLATPFYVAGMTAGHADAWELNRRLALGCEKRGWAMGVGSQRRDLETGDGGLLDHWKGFRGEVPHLALFANIGLSQIIGAKTADLARLVDTLEAQALIVHCNALQEAIQPEGTPAFRGGIRALEKLCRELDRPVAIKETGCGFSRATLQRLRGIGLAAIDISGLGGTHWGRIEGARAEAQSRQSIAAATFANWGESTTDSVLAAREVLPSMEIWASGGVRSGLDAAKLIALGADRVGFAQPALQAALDGAEALDFWMSAREFELKVALFCTGSASPGELRKKETAWKRL